MEQQTIPSPSIGDVVTSTPLDGSYLSYCTFCEQRSIPPPSFARWLRLESGVKYERDPDPRPTAEQRAKHAREIKEALG
jgi:hypothetical protein